MVGRVGSDWERLREEVIPATFLKLPELAGTRVFVTIHLEYFYGI